MISNDNNRTNYLPNDATTMTTTVPIGDYHPPTDARTPNYHPAPLIPTYWFNDPNREEQIRIAALKAASQLESGKQYPSSNDALINAKAFEKYIREG